MPKLLSGTHFGTLYVFPFTPGGGGTSEYSGIYNNAFDSFAINGPLNSFDGTEPPIFGYIILSHHH